MASIDALTGGLTDRKSLDAGSDNDHKLHPESTVSETPAATVHETQEQDEGGDDGSNGSRVQTDKAPRHNPASSISNSVVRDSEDGEDEVGEYIEVGKPLFRKTTLFSTGNVHTTRSDIRVEVPKVQRKWEYRVFAEEYTPRSLLRELRVSDEVMYEVMFEDGHIELVRHPLTP